MSFLESVASELLTRFGTDLSRVAIVFPNKRASLFLNDHLAHLAGRPLWSPAYFTISDLFRSQSSLQVADPILLVCELHRCFTKCTGINETLDHFYGWGQLLLSDFDDVDKNMAPTERVFANVRDLHELDDVSYLTPEQLTLIRRFFSNFYAEHNSELKQRFLRLWSHIGDIYNTFNSHLSTLNLAYEGALYRQVATADTLPSDYDTYVFVGFNLLHKVEQTLIHRFEDAGRALVIQDTIEQPPRQLTYISAPTENIQARYISQWLTPERIADGRRTAIVLCNEGLLQAVIHCLPDEVEKVNVTTGYPLLQTPIASLVAQLLNLQINGFSERNQSFRRHWLDIVARHPYAPYLPEGYADNHITDSAALLHWLADTVRHVATSSSQLSTRPEGALATNGTQELHTESLFRMYTLLNRMSGLADEGELTVDATTLQRLITQLVQSTSIPFHGEPAEGVQVMGVLETRNLDFDHVLLLSCNEGYMPRGVNDTSFIPYAIRKAYGLTTVDHKVAIYQHYFHRLLQRAHDVTLIYNNATTDGQRGEMSRFMLQLMADATVPITFHSLCAPQQKVQSSKFKAQSSKLKAQSIDKTADVISLLCTRFTSRSGISPTAVSSYLRCQLRFFYNYVSDLKEPDSTEEEPIDSRAFGNIYHKAAQILYNRFVDSRVTEGMLDALLEDSSAIERAVDDAIRIEFFHITDVAAKMPRLDGLQLINREVIIKYVRLLVETDRRLAPFTILGLEKPVYMPYEFVVGDKVVRTSIGGIVDRLDCVIDPSTGKERIRVIDYKTGSRRPKAMPDVAAIFDPAQIPNHSDYYLQAFLYSHIIQSLKLKDQSLKFKVQSSKFKVQSSKFKVSPALLFIQHAAAEGYDPTLCLGREPVTDIAPHSEQFLTLLHQTINDIFNPDLPFTPTDDRNRCRSCPYAVLCGIL